jgi:hypothetical protein
MAIGFVNPRMDGLPRAHFPTQRVRSSTPVAAIKNPHSGASVAIDRFQNAEPQLLRPSARNQRR